MLSQMQILALGVGGVFGMALIVAELADPDRIIGTLRLKDFHAMRTIAMFVLTSMVGVWVLSQVGLAHLSIKPAVMTPVAVGGSLLGFGFGMTGFCPGTGLACAAAGRGDAWISVAGMFLGALAFIVLWPFIVPQLSDVWNYGQTTLPEFTGSPSWWWVGGFVGLGGLVLFVTRPRRK
ncbi:MAG: YeeE/YedE family protein [Phycisphaerae bacterium]|nr:YeeE/YedE family protein [Phycisphaerae bacterium]